MSDIKAKVELMLEVPPVPCKIFSLGSDFGIDLADIEDSVLEQIGLAWTKELLESAQEQRKRRNPAPAPLPVLHEPIENPEKAGIGHAPLPRKTKAK